MLYCSAAAGAPSVLAEKAPLPSQKCPHWFGQFSLRQVYNHGDDDAWLNTIGFPRSVFMNVLLPPFSRRYLRKVSGARRPPTLKLCDVLGLVLMFLNSTSQTKSLCLIFGVAPSVLTRAKLIGIKCLVATLQNDIPLAAIRFPTAAGAERLSELIAPRCRVLKGVFAYLDGVRFNTFDPEDFDKQNSMFSGWHDTVGCGCVFLWLPNGLIGAAYINAPGSWHDSLQARELYEHVLQLPPNLKIICDSAFQAGTYLGGRILKVIKGANRDLTEEEEEITFLRQSAEWGNHHLHAAFPRLCTRLPASDDLLRWRLIFCCAHLLNLRTQLTGHSEIMTVHFRSFLANLPPAQPGHAPLVKDCPVSSYFGLNLQDDFEF